MNLNTLVQRDIATLSSITRKYESQKTDIDVEAGDTTGDSVMNKIETNLEQVTHQL